MRVERHDRALDCRELPQRPAAGLSGRPRRARPAIDVAGASHLRRLLDRRPPSRALAHRRAAPSAARLSGRVGRRRRRRSRSDASFGAGLEHHGQLPARSQLEAGIERRERVWPSPPSASISADRPAPAVPAVVGGEAAPQRPSAISCSLRIERGADREAALVEAASSPKRVDQLAAHLLGEVVGRARTRSGAPARTVSGSACAPPPPRRRRCSRPRASGRSPSRAAPARPRDRGAGRSGWAPWAAPARIGGLGDRQLVEGLVEIVERRRGDAIGAVAEDRSRSDRARGCGPW